MLSNILLVILGLYAVTSPLIMIHCIKFGYRMKKDPEKESEKEIKIKPVRKAAKMTAEEEKDLMYWQNIMSYDGTGRGQRIIKD